MFNPSSIVNETTKNIQFDQQQHDKKMSSWSFFKPKQRSQKEIDKETIEQSETERFALIQQIRLYMTNFKELGDLYIIDVRDRDGNALIDKWINKLYNKKTEELEKILHCIKFHTRNKSSDESTTQIGLKMFEITIKIIEAVLKMASLRVDGLTDQMVNDEHVKRCIKEIMIEHSINTLNYGPKTDILIRLGMVIIQKDTENRLKEGYKLKQPQIQHSKNEEILKKKYDQKKKEKYDDI